MVDGERDIAEPKGLDDALTAKKKIETIPWQPGTSKPANENAHSNGKEALFVSSLSSRYPLEALPPLARRYVEENARSIDVPIEYVATPFLAMVGGVIGRNVCLSPKEGFTEFPIVWTVVVGDPGTAKSPALRAALAPIRTLQSEAFAVFERESVLYESQQQPESGDTSEQHQPRLEHFYSTDTTPEAVAPLLKFSSGLVLYRDEITGWVMGDPAPNLPSLISRIFSGYGPNWGGLQTRWV